MNFSFLFGVPVSTGESAIDNTSTMEKSSLPRSQSVDDRSIGLEVDGDSMRERSVHGASREASFHGGNANTDERSSRRGDRDVHLTINKNDSDKGGNRSSSKGLDDDDDDGGEDDDEVELGHHRGLTVAAREPEGPPAPPLGASASASAAPAPPPPAAPRAKFYLEEYDHDLYGAPLWAWPRAYLRKMRGGLDTPMPLPEPSFAVLATLGSFLGIACVGGLDAALGRREILDSPVLLASFGASAVLLFSVPESKVRGGSFFFFCRRESVFLCGGEKERGVGGVEGGGGERERKLTRPCLFSFSLPYLFPFSPHFVSSRTASPQLSQPVNFIGGQMLSAAVGATVRLALSPDRGVPHWLASAAAVAAAVLMMMLTSTTHPPGGATALLAATAARPAPWHGYRLVFSVGIGSAGMQAVALLVNNLHR